ncbi:helix-turn-helix domain-containing protein [Brooklawnia sp.]|uniref:helix-turn-helix domain-containing protein n=1 Tax=Brooklawnia sp. TaxID=2699740 RepID=UPI00311E5DBF
MVGRHFGDRLRVRRNAAGLTQRELAESSGVKQPLIAAIERGTRRPTPATREALDGALIVRPSQILQALREHVRDEIHQAGGTNPRLFGSVARGNDRPDSDVDLLVEFPAGADIIDLLTLEERLSDLLTVPVDIVSTSSSGAVVESALTQAVPL